MNEATFTFRVDQDLKAEFASVAKSLDRTGAQLLRDFMRDLVSQQQQVADHEAWFRHQVQCGIDSANAGELIAADTVEKRFAAKREKTRAELKATG